MFSSSPYSTKAEMSASSQFSDETQSVMDPPGNELNDQWSWMDEYQEQDYVGEPYPPGRRVSWWRRPRIFYPTLVVIVAAMLGLCVTAILFGLNGLSGWRPNQSNASGSSPADDASVNGNDGNVQGTGGLTTLEPSPLPTGAPTVSLTNAPTGRPTMGPRTIPLSFYVMGDGTLSSSSFDCRKEQLRLTFRFLRCDVILQCRMHLGRSGFCLLKF